MKSKNTQFEKSRFRKDYFFSKIVTVFGLLVIATFATLILHILSNAFPLLQSPTTQKIRSIANEPDANTIGSINLKGQWVAVSVNECAISLSELSEKQTKTNPNLKSSISNTLLPLREIKKFAPNCANTVVGLTGEQNRYVLTLNSSNIVEVHYFHDKDTLLLQSSVRLPKDFSLSNVEHWKVALENNVLFIQRPYNQDPHSSSIITLTHDLSSLERPKINLYEHAVDLLPLIKFKQVLVAKHAHQDPNIYPELVMYKQNMEIIQRWSLLDKDLNGVFSDGVKPKLEDSKLSQQQAFGLVAINAIVKSPSSLDIFVRFATNQIPVNQLNEFSPVNIHKTVLKKFTLFNQDGEFLLRETLSTLMQPNFGKGKLYSAFDLQYNAGLFVDEFGHFVLMDIVTGDVKIARSLLNSLDNQSDTNTVNYMNYVHGELQINYNKGFALFKLNDLQGMTSLQTLFGKNDYAGYKSEEYLWQTSVSSELQSPKYSVIPLIMGSLKASILALAVAVPLALGAAIYTAYFAAKHVRSAIKPSIEMLEAIPSVVIGFIAAIWLAPFAEQYLLSLLFVIILLPFVVLTIAAIHGYLKTKLPKQILDNWQFSINSLLLLTSLVFIFLLGLLVANLSASDPNDSLIESISYLSLSKTAIVVSLALGVAIAPTIYTLIDDALYEVPEGVKQASFALGASPIQTLTKVVLVVALPSIVSAVMLGFGRAFGETMIVLMVTGNTPIANWDLLSGLRTLTSNLAIELQEAQVDSTHYHILFLTAAILFAFTFVVNTIASVLKRRMHRNDQ
jgi:phosphate transport system permease protein